MSTSSEKVDVPTLEAMKAVRDYCIKNCMAVPIVIEQNIAQEETKAMKAVRDYCIKNGMPVPSVIEQNIGGVHEEKNVHEDTKNVSIIPSENELILNLDQMHSKNEKLIINSENGMAVPNVIEQNIKMKGERLK